ncbi:hypothetical protein BaRGS_00005168 [Batillaria attramentaria]|uniref:Uncharacterized protein n=1 Tax=Batillaria attramentaria TaxID=370345 RepID=A0ABD0LVG6_9CAEN
MNVRVISTQRTESGCCLQGCQMWFSLHHEKRTTKFSKYTYSFCAAEPDTIIQLPSLRNGKAVQKQARHIVTSSRWKSNPDAMPEQSLKKPACGSSVALPSQFTHVFFSATAVFQ